MDQSQSAGHASETRTAAHQDARQLLTLLPGDNVQVRLVHGEPMLLSGTGIEVTWEGGANDLSHGGPPGFPSLLLTVRVPHMEELAALLPDRAPSSAQAPADRPLDGPGLRWARERQGIPLRHVAGSSNLSHGHLSRVERGEPGQPVGREVVAAYRRAGVVLPGVAVGVCRVPSAQGPEPASSPLMTVGAEWRARNFLSGRRRRGNANFAPGASGGR